ncbi:MAG: PKD domain-containing protein, partial [Bacteroidota bacterium]
MLGSWLICMHGSMAQTSMQQACVGDEVAFPTQINPSLSGIVNWHWDFGDPQSGSVNVSKKLNPTHVFHKAGTYEVQLIIETMAGLVDSIHTQVKIFPVPTFAIDRLSPCDGDSLVLALEKGDEPVQAQWSWGVEEQSSEGLLATMIFPESGTYPIKVSARNGFGCTADTLWSQEWPLTPPAPEIAGAKVICEGSPLELTVKLDPRYKLQWNTQKETKGAYLKGNSFHVPMVDQDLAFTFFYQEKRFSCKSSPSIHQVRVQSAAKLKVSHRYLTPEQLPARIEFRLSSQVPLTFHRWHFGGEQYSSLARPTHTFYTP